MLSSRKTIDTVMEWVENSLRGAMDHGMSLKDDTDGSAVYVDRVRKFCGLVFLDITVEDVGTDKRKSHELCVRVVKSGSDPCPPDLRDSQPPV